MMARFSQTLILAAVGCFCFAPCLLATTVAADDVRKFIEGLRERRYYDTAADYLETLTADERISPEVKQTLPYEQGIVLIESALSLRDPAMRDRKLDVAQSKLKAFLSANAKHELAHQAQQQLAGVLRFRADALLAPTNSTNPASPQIRKEAGNLYDQARGMYSDAAKRLRAKLDELPKDEEGEKREQLGVEWLGARLNAARTMFDLASTRDPGDDRKKLLTEAAKQSDELYSKYPQRLAGITARFYEGRCYQELGDRKKALAAYGDLIADLPESEAAYRALKTQAMKYALQCWLENKDYATAVDKAVPWAKGARGAELRDADWLEVKLSAATALKEFAAKADKNDAKAKSHLNEARELAGEVAKSNQRDFQTRSRLLLAQLGRTDQAAAKTVAFKVPEVSTFDEAFEKAEEATDEIKTSQLELEFLQREEKPDTKEIERVTQSIERYKQQSFELLKRAVELADQNTDPEKLPTTFYLLSFFHYQRGNYLDAALFGEHVARRYPDSASARPGARVAMVAFDAAFRKAQQAGEDVSFESGKLSEMADYVSLKWPDQPEADAAFDALLSLYINQGDYEKAAQTLERIKPDSPSRAEAEAKLGQALWSKYLRAMQQLRQQQTGAEATSPENTQTMNELDALAQQAQAALERGIELIRKQKDVNPRMMLAALSLAQIYANTSQADKALRLLEDSKIGPVTLLEKKHTATQLEGIPAEIYKTAMRAYVGVEPQQIDKATAAMDALEKIYATDPQGESKFTQLLIGIAADLQQQLQELGRSGQGAKQTQQLAAFEQFLRRIVERKSGTDFRTLNWVAFTYQKLADGLTTSGKPSKKAKDFYQQSAKAYEEMLLREKKQPGFIPDGKLLAVKLELAKANRGAGDYAKAIASFAEILKEKQTILPVQVEAAMTYQLRAAAGNADDYLLAMQGGGKGDAANIWGWGQLAKKTSQDSKFLEFFHNARYNLALCRRRYAASRDSAEEKTKHLRQAKEYIRITKVFEPKLGGEDWRPKYEKLLRDIQQALGEPVVGMQEFEKKPSATM
jgi:hypothetical protein